MKIQGKETKYDIGDIVIMAWVDSDPELAVITGINLRYDDYELDGDTSHILTYRTSRIMGGNHERYEGSAGAFLCKITDAEAVKEYAPKIRKAFIDHGFIDKGEDDGEEEKMMEKRTMSRKDMFLAYKRELCAMDGFDDLADPLWTYLADFSLFTSDDDAEWIPVKYDGKEVGFLIALSGKLVRDDTLDYYLWDTYIKPPYRRLGLMRQTVENYVRNHPGTYGLVMMDVNEGAHKFWESVMGKPDGIREWNWPGCRLYVYRKEKSERDRD